MGAGSARLIGGCLCGVGQWGCVGRQRYDLSVVKRCNASLPPPQGLPGRGSAAAASAGRHSRLPGRCCRLHVRALGHPTPSNPCTDYIAQPSLTQTCGVHISSGTFLMVKT